jgi:restriction system protein
MLDGRAKRAKKMKTNMEYISARDFTLQQFLKALHSSDLRKITPNNCFPNIEVLNEFLNTIHSYTYEEVYFVLEKFLVPDCSYGSNIEWFQYLVTHQDDPIAADFIKKNTKLRYFKRLLKGKTAWEGILWILDLLPHFPNEAINVIDSFYLSSCQILPDYALNGLLDASSIIRARFLQYDHPIDRLLELEPLEFEILVAELFKNKGYTAELTKRSYDGGVDIFLTNTEIAKKEKIIVQCKRYKSNIGVKEIRELLGVVSSEKATKGILCCSSNFTASAKQFSENNQRIELINGKNLIEMCNNIFGINWPFQINKNILNNKKDMK